MITMSNEYEPIKMIKRLEEVLELGNKAGWHSVDSTPTIMEAQITILRELQTIKRYLEELLGVS